MRFTYASVGQPGSMHDTNVLFHTLELDANKFPHPPLGMSSHLILFSHVHTFAHVAHIIFIFDMCVQTNII
jgi:type IV secretory pathway TrbL component